MAAERVDVARARGEPGPAADRQAVGVSEWCRASYDRLAAIAPTWAQPADGPSNFAPWDDQTRIVGAALGRAEQAEALIADIEGEFAAAAAAHPQFATPLSLHFVLDRLVPLLESAVAGNPSTVPAP